MIHSVGSASFPQSSHQNVASDFYDVLGDEVSDLLEDTAQRAEDNDRKTVQAGDL